MSLYLLFSTILNLFTCSLPICLYSDWIQIQYTNKDIRFTTKGNKLYAIVLDWPDKGLMVESLRQLDASKIESVTMLGTNGELEWNVTANGLSISTPSKEPCEHAYTYKIVYRGELPSLN